LSTKKIELFKELRNGVEFSCQMCGSCCRGFDEGEVYLYLDDIQTLANHLDFKGSSGLKKFARRYLKIIDESFYWRELGAKKGRTYKYKTLGFKFTGKDEHCQFLKKNKCSVHEYRPFQCRCFPWWQLLVLTKNKANFEDYSKKCRGLQLLKGNFHAAEEIREWAQKEYEIEKNYFLQMKQNDFDIFKVYPFLLKDLLEKKDN